MSILVTGFEPFGGRARNPSEHVVRAIGKMHPPDSVIAEILPVEYDAAHRRLEQLIDQHHPAAWIGFGLNQRAGAIVLERVAVNSDDATIADNSGDLRLGRPIDPSGADSYRSTLPLQRIADAMGHQHIPVSFSDSAGRFVCNHVFYQAINLLKRTNPSALAGFVHIPWPCDWDPQAQACHTVPLATIVKAGQLCVTILLHELPIQKIVAT
jgi:pyroglutamyl-peptidase